jgi:hypothetical protein
MRAHQKPLEVVPVAPPPHEQRVARRAQRYPEGVKRDRYALPDTLRSHSPIGYRARLSLSAAQADFAMRLLSLEPPAAFTGGPALLDQELFEESALGVLSSRQSTNFAGQRQRTFGPQESAQLTALLRRLKGGEGALEGACYTHVILTRPYSTPFTKLLTLAGHKPLISLLTVPLRALRKRYAGATDIPSIGYLRGLHLGILADGLERAVVIASEGRRKALVHIAPFCGALARENKEALRELSELCHLSARERAEGWRVSMVAQVGYVAEAERLEAPRADWRALGGCLLALRSERIQPGVNHEPKAPPQYHQRQDMDVSEELTVQAGRAAYNAFCRWTGVDREEAKRLMLSDRVDVLTPNGKERLRRIRRALSDATDCLVRDLPLWADLPTGRAFSRNAARGRKAFALAGQRIYLMGLSARELEAAGVDWDLAVCATGAAAARSGLYAELMGCVEIPEGCDLLAGVCLMAGPVNQNDIGKTFYGHPDLLDETLSARRPTSLLVWTLKAKTVADPIGNEEQLMSASRKGALVDLRCGPHELISLHHDGAFKPFRERGDVRSEERAYADLGNFLTSPTGEGIEGNEGRPWAWGAERVWG